MNVGLLAVFALFAANAVVERDIVIYGCRAMPSGSGKGDSGRMDMARASGPCVWTGAADLPEALREKTRK